MGGSSGRGSVGGEKGGGVGGWGRRELGEEGDWGGLAVTKGKCVDGGGSFLLSCEENVGSKFSPVGRGSRSSSALFSL